MAARPSAIRRATAQSRSTSARDAVAPERPQRGVDRRKLGRDDSSPGRSRTGRARRRERAAGRRPPTPVAARWAAASRMKTRPESYGTFSHLWASVAPRVRPLMPAQVPRIEGVAAAQSPNAPSMCSHVPGRVATTSAIVVQRIEGARVHLAGLRRTRSSDPRAARRVPARRSAGAHAAPRRRWPLGSPAPRLRARPAAAPSASRCAHARRRRRGPGAADEPVLLDIPADGPQDGVARGHERDEMGHRRPGREADRRSRPADPSRSIKPLAGDSSTTEAAGVPRNRPTFCSQADVEPIRRQGGRHGAADHEPEVARRAHGHEARLDVSQPCASMTAAGSSPCPGAARRASCAGARPAVKPGRVPDPALGRGRPDTRSPVRPWRRKRSLRARLRVRPAGPNGTRRVRPSRASLAPRPQVRSRPRSSIGTPDCRRTARRRSRP